MAAGMEMRALRLGVKRTLVEGEDSMRKIRWNERHSEPAATKQWMVPLSCGALLLALSALASAASGTRATPPPEQILARMERRFELQLQALESYQARRRYSVEHSLLDQPGTLVVEEHYSAPGERPGERTFRVLERHGSSVVQEKVFSRLLEVEQATTPEAVRRDLDLNRRNYLFTYERYDPRAGAYVFAAEPRGSNPYLLRGKIWINAQDFGVQRIEGEPIQRHSVFVRQTHFVHEFARFGEFWFPVRHQSETDLFLMGRAVLRINYSDYHWQERLGQEKPGQANQEQAKQQHSQQEAQP